MFDVTFFDVINPMLGELMLVVFHKPPVVYFHWARGVPLLSILDSNLENYVGGNQPPNQSLSVWSWHSFYIWWYIDGGFTVDDCISLYILLCCGCGDGLYDGIFWWTSGIRDHMVGWLHWPTWKISLGLLGEGEVHHTRNCFSSVIITDATDMARWFKNLGMSLASGFHHISSFYFMIKHGDHWNLGNSIANV